LPYDVVVVAPEKVYAETFDVDPENIALQLHYGCLQADLIDAAGLPHDLNETEVRGEVSAIELQASPL
jgi:hypothetical protein